MRVPAVAVDGTQTVATIAVYAQGTFGQAVGAMLAMRGNRVTLVGETSAQAFQCEVYTQSRARYSSAVSMDRAADAAFVRSCDSVIVAVPATSYGAACEDLVRHLKSGQTLFMVGAAFGASLEMARLLGERRTDLAVSIVEICQPFTAAYSDGKSLVIKNVRESLAVAGCSLNETRAGLSAGGAIFNNLVPASNVLERGFSNIDRWLDTAALLFEVFGSNPGKATTAVLSTLKSELLALAKAYRVNRLPEPVLPANGTAAGSDAPKRLAERVIEDFVLLSELARLARVTVPVLDAVIDLSAATTNIDLRREARQLSDLGLIGMDAPEIIEHVSA